MVILGGPARASDPLTIAAQGSFFVGGRDVASDTLSIRSMSAIRSRCRPPGRPWC
jgi:hypothetical protein